MNDWPSDPGWNGGRLVNWSADRIAYYWPEQGRLAILYDDWEEEVRNDVVDWDHAREITLAWFDACGEL